MIFPARPGFPDLGSVGDARETFAEGTRGDIVCEMVDLGESLDTPCGGGDGVEIKSPKSKSASAGPGPPIRDIDGIGLDRLGGALAAVGLAKLASFMDRDVLVIPKAGDEDVSWDCVKNADGVDADDVDANDGPEMKSAKSSKPSIETGLGVGGKGLWTQAVGIGRAGGGMGEIGFGNENKSEDRT